VSEAISEPRTEHEQPAEEHRIAGGDDAAHRLHRANAGQHPRQCADDHGYPENVDALHGTQHNHRHPWVLQR
jgi:hypothetical protein